MLSHKLGDGITIVRDYAADLPRIEANPGELNQVWTNLIENAVDAMDGEGTLRVSTRADGDHVVVEVADTGAGMPADVQARAFDPFYTTKDVGKGTGLGLDISRRIVVENHHGEITIMSEPGEHDHERLPPTRARVARVGSFGLPSPQSRLTAKRSPKSDFFQCSWSSCSTSCRPATWRYAVSNSSANSVQSTGPSKLMAIHPRSP